MIFDDTSIIDKSTYAKPVVLALSSFEKNISVLAK